MAETDETPTDKAPTEPPATPTRAPFDRRLAAIYLTGAVIAVLVVAITVSIGVQKSDKTSAKTSPAGVISLDSTPGPFTATTLPDAGLVTMDGTVTDLPNVTKGRPTVVNLFSSTCVPCRQEMPALQALHTQLGDKAQVVGVDLGESQQVTADFVKSTGARYEILRDPTSLLVTRLNVTNQPFTLWIDASGRIAGHTYGGMSPTEMRSHLKKYLSIDLPAP